MVIELPQFQEESLTAFVEAAAEIAPISRRVTSAFPDEFVYDINFAYEFFKSNARKAAKITGFNASAPIRSKGQAEKVFGQITKIQDSYYFDETDLLHFNRPRDPKEKEVLEKNFLYGINDIALGIDDIVEHIAAQLVYNATVKYIDPYTKTQLEFKMPDRPEGNDIEVVTPWSEAGARPLDDIRFAMKQYQKTNNNRKPDRIDMNTTTLELLTASEQVRQEIYGSTTDARLVMPDQVTQLFTRMGLPAPYVNDDYITLDALETDEDGNTVMVEKYIPHITDGKFVMYADNMGSTVRGITAEKNYQHGKFVYPKKLEDSIGEQVIVGEAVMPTLKAINSNVIVTVL